MTNSRIVTGSIWLTAAKLLTTCIGFVATIVLARLLTPEDYGLVALATATLAIVNAFTELPVTVALIQIRQPTRQDYNSAFTLNVARGLAISVALVVAAPFVARMYQDDRLIHIFYVLALAPLFNAALNPYFVVFEREMRFSKNFIIEFSAKLVAVVVAVVIAIMFRSYWALIGSLIASSLIAMILSYVLVPYRPGLSVSSLPKLWNFSSWLSLVSIVNTLNQRLDSFVVASLMGKGMLGQFSLGNDVANMVHSPATPIMRALYSRFCQLADDVEALRDTYRKSQYFIIAAILPAGFGLGLVAEPLVRAALGEEWLGAVIVIQVIAPMIAIELIAGASYPLAMAMGKTRALFWRDLAVFLFRMPLMIAGAYFYGLVGLVVSRGIASVFGLLLNLRLVDTLIGMSVLAQIKGAWRSGASVVLMSAAVLAALQLTQGQTGLELYAALAGTIGLGATVYIASHFGLWFMSGCPETVEAQALAILRRLFPRQRLAASS
jgi:O-antigen/teichoic acid export membrane protein